MINRQIVEELKKVTGIKYTSNIYKLIDKAKQDHFIVDRETAAYFLAFKKGIRIEKYLKPEELQKVQTVRQNGPTIIEKQRGQRQQVETSNEKDSTQNNKMSKTIEKIIAIGKKYGIENIDQNWIDGLTILNFIETASTKFLMDHDYTEEEVKKMKWEEKLTKLQNKLYEEAKVKQFTIRTSVATFFKNYRGVRNDQDHIAHLPSSHVTKDEISLLQKNLDIFIKTVFVEHKKYCLK